MKIYTTDQLKEILELHQLWLQSEEKGTCADLRGAIGLPIADDAPSRLLAVAKSALSSSDALEMGTWHTCETTHCVCGWAEHLGGSLAKLIVEQFGNDVGGLMLLGVKAHSYFYSTNGQARAFLQSVIDNAEVGG